ncbi:MAG: hypothetical protein WBA34_06465, partial [Candidatus Deferrimicrobiaceae bacterium]
MRGAIIGFRILGGGSLASSLDLRNTRKSALALPPGKAPLGPPFLDCSADDAATESTGTLRRCGGFREAACGARVVYPRRAGSESASGTGSERAQGRERSGV